MTAHAKRRTALLEALSNALDHAEGFSTGTLEKLAEQMAGVLKEQAEYGPDAEDLNAEAHAHYSLMLALHGPGPWD